MKKYIALFLLFLNHSIIALATHNRAGEITYEHVENRTYKITVTTYTYTPSLADRDTLTIDWGDGTTDEVEETISRTKWVNLPNDIRKNTYIAYHDFPGDGFYEIVMTDPNRNEGIENIPNSVNIVFTLRTRILIKTNLGNNTAPELFNPPVDKAFVGQKFTHNPMAYDVDGDSLAYKLVKCLGTDANDISGYSYPRSSNEPINIDPITGDLSWDAPTRTGEFNVAFIIEEFRNGIKIGEILRDLQIDVSTTKLKPPEIEVENEKICVIAGQSITFDVTARNPNGGIIKMTGIGGILDSLHQKAFFSDKIGVDVVTSNFRWQTTCSDTRVYPYNITFKAEIPSEDNQIKLVKYRNVMINVIAPPPTILQPKASDNEIELKWEHGECPGVYQYRIYRKVGASDFDLNECTTGLPANAGYTLINTVQSTDFIDDNDGLGLMQGLVYCYRIVGVYGDGALSMPSEEVCETLIKSKALITNVDVEKTDETDGEIIIKWIRPTEFDSIRFPGPYFYKIFRSNTIDGGISVPIGDVINGIEQHTYVDKSIDTKNQTYSYSNSFYNLEADGSESIIGTSDEASQVELTIQPGGYKLNLQFRAVTPWIIDSTIIYKQNKETLAFEPIDTVVGNIEEVRKASDENKYKNNFLDTDVLNEIAYCYYVESYGHYLDESIKQPLINRSPVVCATPYDDIPPCPPLVDIKSNCIESFNYLKWTNPNNSCTDDVVSYRIYYRDTEEQEWTPRGEPITNLADTTYSDHINGKLRGCYAVTATDKTGNESQKTNNCVDMCLQYELPNVFTPDGDNVNDIYLPITNVDVEKVDMTIYNRWGNVVFETDNPEIKWDGRNQSTKEELADGVYYYICDVHEERSSGVEIRNITGFIHLIRHEKIKE